MRWSLTTLALLLASAAAFAQAPIQGLRDNVTPHYALINATIISEPGQRINGGTVLIEGERIVAVGDDVDVPQGVQTIDLNGAYVYPGFIDLMSNYGLPEPEESGYSWGDAPIYNVDRPGAVSWNEALHAEQQWVGAFQPDAAAAKALRDNGFAAVHTARQDGILRGRGALVSLAPGSSNERVINADGLHVGAFNKGSSSQAYPSSLMGSIALLRQTLSDARWYQQVQQADRTDLLEGPVVMQRGLAALADVFQRGLLFDAGNAESMLRASALASEFGLPVILYADHQAWEHADALAETGHPLVLSLDMPKPPPVATAGEALDASLNELRRWERAPYQPAMLAQAGLRFAFTQHGLDSTSDFWGNVRKAVQRGLAADTALAALTTTPASLLGAEAQLGRLAPGYRANLVIADAELFVDNGRLLETWVDGQREVMVSLEQRQMLGDYQGTLTGIEGSLTVSPAPGNGLSARFKHEDGQLALDDVSLVFGELRGVVGEAFGDWAKGTRLVLRRDAQGVRGEALALDGDRMAISLASAEADEAEETPAAELLAPVSRLVSPNQAFGLATLPEAQDVLVRNATIWTMSEAGVLENADLLVRDGIIREVGSDLRAPRGAIEIDAEGRHVTPGLIDEHSHIAISRGVNEGSHPVTSEVRIADVVTGNDVNIYRGLAGGTTVAQLLHGSANPIGGQAQVIKLRWGQDAEGLKMAEAPPSMKFALGENVKQSNWGDQVDERYPQTRMGVNTLMRDALTAAQEYQARQVAYSELSRRAKRDTAPPRIDYQLQALAEVLASERYVHVHSYVASEILAFIRLAERMGFTIQTFTHILEGYKVAEEMAEHGAGASSFADWWAYKYEVIDAIPYNTCLMMEAGVLTSVNSDSADLHRRLNQEAAKSLTYCDNVSDEQALALVTINPAKQLKIDQYVGSLEEGKHADFVVWNDHPLSVYATVDETWVDGRRYFSREQDAELRNAAQAEKQALIERILAGDEKPREADERDAEHEHEWHCEHNIDVWTILNAGGQS
jgi:imidazolonepropionase-like amidohydrolase